jgi:hypothetical protein
MLYCSPYNDYSRRRRRASPSRMKLRFLSGGYEAAIVNRAFAERLSVVSGYRARSFRAEEDVLPVLRRILSGGQASVGLRSAAGGSALSRGSDDEVLRAIAHRILSGDLAIVERWGGGGDTFVHPRPTPVSPLEMETAQQQRDPEPAPPPPPMTPDEFLIIPEEQAAALVTDAPVCET